MLLSQMSHLIPPEITDHTPSHMDHMPATDLVDSAWSSILATMAMAIRNSNRYHYRNGNRNRNHNCSINYNRNLLKWRRI
jgi:hypothetical protein